MKISLYPGMCVLREFLGTDKSLSIGEVIATRNVVLAGLSMLN